MKLMAPGLVALLCCAAPLPAAAQIAGNWHLAGNISGNDFALDCNFVPQGALLTGACSTANHQGHVYTLNQGVVEGGAVHFSYPASYLFLHFNMNYAGTLDGDRITGTVEAEGRRGTFWATRE